MTTRLASILRVTNDSDRLTGAFALAAALCGACGTSDAGSSAPSTPAIDPVPTIANHAMDCQGDDDHDSIALRNEAAQSVRWEKETVPANRQVPVKILGINDFHGQLSPRTVGGRPAGGAAVLASYLEAAAAGLEDSTFIANAGDNVDASPPNSALLQDEPAITLFNLLANDDCKYGNKLQPKCNVVGTLGNHEFDEGRAELNRLLEGGTPGGSGPTSPLATSPGARCLRCSPSATPSSS